MESMQRRAAEPAMKNLRTFIFEICLPVRKLARACNDVILKNRMSSASLALATFV